MCSTQHFSRLPLLIIYLFSAITLDLSIPRLLKTPHFRAISEFVLGLAQFAIRDQDREKKLEFIFSIYDMDRDGYISNGELFQASAGERSCLIDVMMLMDSPIVSGAEDDGWQEPERIPAPADRGQNDCLPGQGSGRQNQLR